MKHISKHPLYPTWYAMVHRCTNPRHPQWDDYGGRGVTVQDSWLPPSTVGFLNWLEDMGDRPEGATLDRKDNDIGYIASNCRWTSRSVQGFNRRHCKPGKTLPMGVVWRESQGKYIACWYATKDGKSREITLGRSSDMFEAICMRKSWESSVGDYFTG